MVNINKYIQIPSPGIEPGLSRLEVRAVNHSANPTHTGIYTYEQHSNVEERKRSHCGGNQFLISERLRL